MNNTSKHSAEIALKGSLEEVNYLASALDQFALENSLTGAIKNQINLILEELYINSVNYALKDLVDSQVIIRLELMGDKLKIIYQDNGPAFNPLEIADPDLTLSLDDRPIGGLGIFFVKSLTDAVSYSREGELNQIKMQKTLCPSIS